ncbi:MAG TPA: heavy metal translocating P-type ATPase [Miltoncostaeaceae bacterium]|nr:heavy metal translocating P-type ATPase [Miltoncostaeaceae bacterium]
MTHREPTVSLPALPERLDLPIEGMTCASCAARVARSLNGLEGVDASVNLATETATVAFDPGRIDPARLVEAVEATGYRARLPGAGEPGREGDGGLGRRLAVSAALSLPVLLVSMIPALRFGGWEWAALALAAPVVLWGGWPFHRAAWAGLRHRAASMDTLISLGTLAALGWSATVVLSGADAEVYLEVATVVTTFLLAGRWLEARAKRRAGAALTALLELGAKEASLLGEDGSERQVPVAELRVGDRFLVRPGERIATDGVVEAGSSAIDRSLLTGESVPVEVGPGDEVAGATVNAGGRLEVRATRVGADTALSQIARLVTEAQSGVAPVQRLADRVSAVFVPAVIALAAATLGVWLAVGGGAAAAFTAAVAVLIVACPCALGLATPVALMVGTGRGAQLGILIRGPEVLESTRRVDTVVLDKTGTVTTGAMGVVDVVPAAGADRGEVLRLAGALEDASEHPIGRAIAEAARADAGALPPPEGFASREGLGVEGVVDGHAVVVGRPALLADWGLTLDDRLRVALERSQDGGGTAVAVAWDGAVRGLVVVADTVRPTSAEAVRLLRGQGLRPVLLTGDNAAAGRAVAAEVGVDEVVADVLPSEKAAVVRRLQREGRVVAVVGDGVNDAPALAHADLGIAVGTGTDVAIEASDLTLVSGDLRGAADAIALSRRTLRTIKGNLFWAFAYNVAALPLAAAGYLDPLIAGAAMALSSLFVIGNSLRLRRFPSLRRAS